MAIIYPGSGTVVLTGTAWADTIYGSPSNETIDGGDCDDVIFPGGGHDKLQGGSGSDTVSYADQSTTVVVRLLSGTAYLTEPAAVIGLGGIENAVGGMADDKLYGDGVANLLDGGAGDDDLFGGDGADVLKGGEGRDRLAGEAGDDILIGGAGNDLLRGGAGNDTASYVDAVGAVLVDLAGGRAEDIDGSGGSGTDTLVGIENAIGSGHADRLSGDAGANRLTGGGRNDVLVGRDGADTLVGGAGNDLLEGGAGSDTFVFASGDGGDSIFGWGSGDSIDLRGVAGVDDFADLTIESSGTGTVVHAGDVSIGLWFVGASQLDASDFVF